MELHDSLVWPSKEGKGLLILQSQLSHPEGATWIITTAVANATYCISPALISHLYSVVCRRLPLVELCISVSGDDVESATTFTFHPPFSYFIGDFTPPVALLQIRRHKGAIAVRSGR